MKPRHAFTPIELLVVIAIIALGELTSYLSQEVRRTTKNAQSPTVAGRYDPALTMYFRHRCYIAPSHQYSGTDMQIVQQSHGNSFRKGTSGRECRSPGSSM